MASSNAIKAGEAYINMSLEDADLAEGLSGLSSKFAAMSGPMLTLGTAMAGLGFAMVAPLMMGVKQMMDYTAEVQRAADRTGIAGEEMSKLALAAKFAGSSFQALEIGLKTIGERVLQLRAGAGETVDAFRLLGINIQEFIGASSTSERLVMIARRMAEVKDAGLQAGLALRTLGEAGNQLLPLLRLGDGLGDIMRQASGIAATQEEMDKSLRLTIAFDQAMAALSQIVVSATAAISDDLANALDVATNLMIRFISWLRTPFAQEMIQTLVVLAGILVTFGSILSALGGMLLAVAASALVAKAAVAIMGTLFGAIAFVIIKVTAIIMAFGIALGTIVGWFSGAFEYGITLTERFSRVWDHLVSAVKGGAVVLSSLLGPLHNEAQWLYNIEGWSRSVKNWFSSWGEGAEEAAEKTKKLVSAMDPLTKSSGSFGSYASAATMGSAPSMTITQTMEQLNLTAREGNGYLSQIASNTSGGLQ